MGVSQRLVEKSGPWSATRGCHKDLSNFLGEPGPSQIVNGNYDG